MRALLLAGLIALTATAALADPRVRFESRGVIAPPAGVATKDFGGLSGIDYDPALKRYVAISDDASQHGAARFYEARIALGSARMTITATHTLTNESGAPFPTRGTGGEQADGESIRVDPMTGFRLWSSEGDINAAIPPALRWTNVDGTFRNRLPLPAAMTAGVRHNLAYEGVAFTPSGDLWVGLENPAAQDGPITTPQAGALTRLTLLDRFGAIRRQVAYPLDPIWKATPGKAADAGLSEILWLDDQRLLVLERAGVQIEGTNYAFHCRLYLADLSRASDVTDVARLAGADIRLTAKTLLADFDTVPGGPVGNLEGMSWAPKGRFGPRRIVFVTDNNFDPKWASTLLVYKFWP